MGAVAFRPGWPARIPVTGVYCRSRTGAVVFCRSLPPLPSSLMAGQARAFPSRVIVGHVVGSNRGVARKLCADASETSPMY